VRAALFGSLGSAFAALCCAGVPAVVGALSAAGLGFLVNDLILLPLLVLSLGLALWGLGRGVARHGLRGVLVLGWVGAMLMAAGIFFRPLVYVGAAAMIGAALWNALALR
jgi:mercuric ion transport protein